MRLSVAHGVRLLALLVVLCVASPVMAGERISVFMVVDGDRALAENLVEVTIAKLSGAGDWELVGMRELESHLNRLEEVKNAGLATCLRTPECLSEIGARAGTPRAVIGNVERAAKSYEVELSLVDTRTFSTERRAGAATAGDVNELIAAVQRGAAKLFELDAPPLADRTPLGPVAAPSGVGAPASAPVAQTAALGATHSSASMALADAVAPLPAERTPVPTYIGFGAAGLAVVAFSAAVIAGVVAKSPPNDETRKAYEEDLERRKDYAAAANIAFATGGVLSAIAVVAFVWE
jgi:hypothetical protein